MPVRVASLPVFLAALTGSCSAALVPVHVTGVMTGSADIADHASGISDTEAFDAPLRVEDLSSATTQRTRTASVGAHTAQAWSQCDSGTTPNGGLRASVMSFAAQSGESQATCNRAATASTTQTTEFKVTSRAQAFRLRGALSGVSEPGVADAQQRRVCTIRLIGESGVVHESTPTLGATATTFDTPVTLEPGTYRVEVTTRARAESGKTKSADPMIASVQWTLEPTTAVASRK